MAQADGFQYVWGVVGDAVATGHNKEGLDEGDEEEDFAGGWVVDAFMEKRYEGFGGSGGSGCGVEFAEEFGVFACKVLGAFVHAATKSRQAATGGVDAAAHHEVARAFGEEGVSEEEDDGRDGLQDECGTPLPAGAVGND